MRLLATALAIHNLAQRMLSLSFLTIVVAAVRADFSSCSFLIGRLFAILEGRSSLHLATFVVLTINIFLHLLSLLFDIVIHLSIDCRWLLLVLS